MRTKINFPVTGMFNQWNTSCDDFVKCYFENKKLRNRLMKLYGEIDIQIIKPNGLYVNVNRDIHTIEKCIKIINLKGRCNVCRCCHQIWVYKKL